MNGPVLGARLKEEINRALTALGLSTQIALDQLGTFGNIAPASTAAHAPILCFGRKVGSVIGWGKELRFWADHLGAVLENELLKNRLHLTARQADRGALDLHNLLTTAQELSASQSMESIAQTLLYCAFGLMAVSQGSVEIDGRVLLSKGEFDPVLEIPLESHGVPLGTLKLGKKLSGERYSEEDEATLTAIAQQAAIAVECNSFREKAQSAAFDLQKTFDSLIEALAISIDARHTLTGSHTQRVTLYAVQLAEAVGLDAENVEIIRIASLLHDVGKIGIPDEILKKPGTFTDEEFAIMKKHATISREILEKICFPPSQQRIPEIAGGHHEKWNGRGYPQGLAGNEIPLGSRIIALADVYDALTSKRDYREAMPTEQALKILEEGNGQHFDPDLAPRFIELIRREVAKETKEAKES